MKNLYKSLLGKTLKNNEMKDELQNEIDDIFDLKKSAECAESQNVNDHCSDAQNIISKVESEDFDIVRNELDCPEVRVKTSMMLNDMNYVVGISLQGRGHILTKAPCQDYHKFMKIASGWYLAVVSDGAGSAKEAARGSKANCELAMKLMCQLLNERKWIENEYFPSDKEWYIEVRNIFEVIQLLIAKKVNQSEEGLEPRDFNATLILMLVTPKGILTAHIGDGRMGYLSQDGVWKALMTPHKGDEASSTVFIPNNWNCQYLVPTFRMSDVFLPDTSSLSVKPKAIVLMSDGCENFAWKCMTYDKEKDFCFDQNEPFAGFMNPLLDEMNTINDSQCKLERLIDIINIGTIGGRKEQDDRTFVMIVFND